MFSSSLAGLPQNAIKNSQLSLNILLNIIYVYVPYSIWHNEVHHCDNAVQFGFVPKKKIDQSILILHIHLKSPQIFGILYFFPLAKCSSKFILTFCNVLWKTVYNVHTLVCLCSLCRVASSPLQSGSPQILSCPQLYSKVTVSSSYFRRLKHIKSNCYPAWLINCFV